MPILKRPDAEIYYEVHGKGFRSCSTHPAACARRSSSGAPVPMACHALDGPARGAGGQVHCHLDGPAQRRKVGGRREAPTTAGTPSPPTISP